MDRQEQVAPFACRLAICLVDICEIAGLLDRFSNGEKSNSPRDELLPKRIQCRKSAANKYTESNIDILPRHLYQVSLRVSASKFSPHGSARLSAFEQRQAADPRGWCS